jgi:hypothetical protein
MVMVVLIVGTIDTDVPIEITIIINLGIGLISAMVLALMAPALIVREDLMQLRYRRLQNCRRLPWMW